MKRRGTRLRTSLSATLPKADPVEGRKDGFIVGYSYGVQHGQKTEKPHLRASASSFPFMIQTKMPLARLEESKP